MNNVILSEWIKLHRTSMLIALLAAIAVTTLSTAIAVANAGQSAAHGGRILSGGTDLSQAVVTSSTGLATALGGAGTLLGIICLGVVAAAVAGEFSHGTLRNLLIREPRRVRLLLGKLTALALTIAATVLVATVIASVVAVLIASSKGFATSSWWTGAGIEATLASVAQLAAGTLGWSALGAVLAVAFRSPVAAIGVGVVYALPLEGVLGGINDSVSRWLPGKLFSAIAAGGDDTASLTAASITAAVYVAAALAAAVWWFDRTDVAA